MVAVACQVLLVDEQVMVRVQLPELAVDDVEVFVGEVLSQLVHVFLLLQQSHVLQHRQDILSKPLETTRLDGANVMIRKDIHRHRRVT